jgi:hypothetical protein
MKAKKILSFIFYLLILNRQSRRTKATNLQAPNSLDIPQTDNGAGSR